MTNLALQANAPVGIPDFCHHIERCPVERLVNQEKIAFKVDKTGIVHASIGRISFAPEKISENSTELINAILKLKPSSSKGTYLKAVSMASTMSPGITLDTKQLIN